MSATATNARELLDHAGTATVSGPPSLREGAKGRAPAPSITNLTISAPTPASSPRPPRTINADRPYQPDPTPLPSADSPIPPTTPTDFSAFDFRAFNLYLDESMSLDDLAVNLNTSTLAILQWAERPDIRAMLDRMAAFHQRRAQDLAAAKIPQLVLSLTKAAEITFQDLKDEWATPETKARRFETGRKAFHQIKRLADGQTHPPKSPASSRLDASMPPASMPSSPSHTQPHSASGAATKHSRQQVGHVPSAART